jgi:DNA-binding ferritin-like protein
MSDRTFRAAHSLSVDRWEEIGHELNAASAELHDLSLTGTELLGSAVEPLFRPLHERLDELVELWRELGDHLAEQVQFAAGAEH